MADSFVTPWTVAHQALLSMEFSRQEYFSGLPFPSPGDLPHPGIEPGSPALQSDSLPSEPPGKPHYSVLKILSLLMGFSRQKYWSGLPFPSPVDHSLSELSTMTLLYWVAPHGMVHSFTGLDKAVIHVISLISFLWLWFSFCPALWCIRIRKLQ